MFCSELLHLKAGMPTVEVPAEDIVKMEPLSWPICWSKHNCLPTKRTHTQLISWLEAWKRYMDKEIWSYCKWAWIFFFPNNNWFIINNVYEMQYLESVHKSTRTIVYFKIVALTVVGVYTFLLRPLPRMRFNWNILNKEPHAQWIVGGHYSYIPNFQLRRWNLECLNDFIPHIIFSVIIHPFWDAGVQVNPF